MVSSATESARAAAAMRNYFGSLVAVPDLLPAGYSWCAVLLVDIDDFIVRSRQRGADWGRDKVAGVGRLVEVIVRDRVAASATHLDPDEWLIVLAGDDQARLDADRVEVANRLLQAVREESEVTVTVSCGAVVERDGLDITLYDALTAHDRKLLLGGNRVIEGSAEAAQDGSPGRQGGIDRTLAQRIRQGDRDGAVLALRRWLDNEVSVDGMTTETLRRRVAAQVLSALNAAGERRAVDGSASWEEMLDRASLDQIAALGRIHEQSYLNLWFEELMARVIEPESSDSHPILALVTSYMEKHFQDDLSLAQVATAVGCSRYTISHLFQQELATTFLTHLTAIRMRHARRLLATSDAEITEIAEQVGYRTPRHFRNVFKRSVGTTPSAYRQSRSGAATDDR